MATPNYSINYSAQLLDSENVAVGDCLIPNASGVYVKATAANRALYGVRCDGIALTASAGESVQMQQVGKIGNATSGLGSGTAGYVRVSSAGRLERCTPAVGDEVVGWAEADGSVHVGFGFPGLGGGSSGTGFVITGGGFSFVLNYSVTFDAETRGETIYLEPVEIDGNTTVTAYTLTLADARWGTGTFVLKATCIASPVNDTVEPHITAEATAGGGSLCRVATVRRWSGGVAIVDQADLWAHYDGGGAFADWDCEFDTSGTGIRVRATGSVDGPMLLMIKLEVEKLG
ncbi:MAG TPA: hypothetical protein VEA38_24835 [Terriglobales bacterium]|nr:hypothetical protein [Terriglobales bacterium]